MLLLSAKCQGQTGKLCMKDDLENHSKGQQHLLEQRLNIIRDLEDLEKLDASEIYPPRINAKKVLITLKENEFIFPEQLVQQKLSGRDYEFREPLQDGNKPKGTRFSVKKLKANRVQANRDSR